MTWNFSKNCIQVIYLWITNSYWDMDLAKKGEGLTGQNMMMSCSAGTRVEKEGTGVKKKEKFVRRLGREDESRLNCGGEKGKGWSLGLWCRSRDKEETSKKERNWAKAVVLEEHITNTINTEGDGGRVSESGLCGNEACFSLKCVSIYWESQKFLNQEIRKRVSGSRQLNFPLWD